MRFSLRRTNELCATDPRVTKIRDELFQVAGKLWKWGSRHFFHGDSCVILAVGPHDQIGDAC